MKRSMSASEHQVLGADLRGAREAMLRGQVAVSRAYSVRDPAVLALGRALGQLDKARRLLEDRLYREHGDDGAEGAAPVAMTAAARNALALVQFASMVGLALRRLPERLACRVTFGALRQLQGHARGSNLERLLAWAEESNEERWSVALEQLTEGVDEAPATAVYVAHEIGGGNDGNPG